MMDQTDSTISETQSIRPIFILGIMQRSGTNFLSDLLCAHPSCGTPTPIWEDFLVAKSDDLIRYVDAVGDCWGPGWGVADHTRESLAQSIGDGILEFLQDQCDEDRVVTKTPSVQNLDMFSRVFRGADLLILVRDGRSVVESGVNSFNWFRDSAIHKWADAAETIDKFSEKHGRGEKSVRFLIVQYEDLWTNPAKQLADIFNFLDLDADSYNFGLVRKLPVRGSSTHGRSQNSQVDWTPKEMTSDFDPMSRFRDWTRARHVRFNWVAGRYLTRFGYQPHYSHRQNPLWILWNLAMDLRWEIARRAGPHLLRWKRSLDSRNFRQKS